MKKYHTYKNSGLDWLGEIPSDWETIKLGYLFKPISIKNNIDEMNLSVYRDYGVIPRDSRDDNHNVVSEDTSNYKLVDVGDFVMNKMKCWMGSLGISDYKGIVSPSYTVLKPTKKNVGKYYHYLLRSKTYIPQYKRLSYGVRIGQWDLRFEDFRDIVGLVPTIQEQQQIVDFLDTKTSLIDSLIEKTQKKIELLKEKRISLINQVVINGLNLDVEMKDCGVEWIGSIPIGWEKSKIKFLSQKISKGTTPSTVGGMILENGPIFYIKMSDFGQKTVNIPNNFIDFDTNELLKRSSLIENDILFVITGEIGRTVIVTKEVIPSNINQNISFIRLKKKDFVKFTWYWLSSDILKTQLKTLYNVSTLPSLSMEDLGNLHIPQPPIDEQKKIVEYLDEHTEIIDTTITKEEKRIELLKEYRQSLISEVVTGKIKVCD